MIVVWAERTEDCLIMEYWEPVEGEKMNCVATTLNQKLAKWAGFKWVKRGAPCPWDNGATIYQVYGWEHPDGSINLNSIHTPDFTTSLDACFKWLVPKLQGFSEIQFYHSESCEWVCYVQLKDAAKEIVASTPSLSLCKAIEKLIE